MTLPSNQDRCQPLVSVSMTTYNCAPYVEQAVRSALTQDYTPLEVVIVDDASTDQTYECLQSIHDPRLRLYRNQRRLGQTRNRNRAVVLTQGQLIKFLDGDDYLEPSCISKMAAIFASEPTVGLVFCRRTIVNERGVVDEADQWAHDFLSLHQDIPDLAQLNDGRRILRDWLAAGLNKNWIGEPTAVMVRRDQLCRVGGFREHKPALGPDIDLWARMLPHSKAGFVDEPLVRYRHGHESETARNWGARKDWVGRLAILESISADPAIRRWYPELGRMLRAERRHAWRIALKMCLTHTQPKLPLRPYFQYLNYRLLLLLCRLHHQPRGCVRPLASHNYRSRWRLRRIVR